MDELKLTISVDSTDVQILLDEAQHLIEASPAWLVWLTSEAFQRLHEVVDLLPVDGDDALATSTGYLRTRAKPTHELVLLVAALRAGNGQPGAGIAFERELGHGDPHE